MLPPPSSPLCPVCGAPQAGAEALSAHMGENHTKDQIVQALVQQQQPQQQQPRPAGQAPQQPPSTSTSSTSSSSSSSSLFLPQMMNLMSMPLLIPQPNGQPPLLVNMPYGYNVQMAAAAAANMNMNMNMNMGTMGMFAPQNLMAAATAFNMATSPAATAAAAAAPASVPAAAPASVVQIQQQLAPPPLQPQAQQPAPLNICLRTDGKSAAAPAAPVTPGSSSAASALNHTSSSCVVLRDQSRQQQQQHQQQLQAPVHVQARVAERGPEAGAEVPNAVLLPQARHQMPRKTIKTLCPEKPIAASSPSPRGAGAPEEEEEAEPVPSTSRGPAPAVPKAGPTKLKGKGKGRRDAGPKPAPVPVPSPASSPSRVTTVHDTLLSTSSTSSEVNPLLSSMKQEPSEAAAAVIHKKEEEEAPGSSGAGEGTSAGAFGFSQYPSASLNFSSMLNEPQKGEKSKPPKHEQQEETPGSEPVPGPSTDSSSSSSSSSSASGSKVVSMDEGSNSNVCTVQTVSDLQNALEGDDDIQIVVPNELLETHEFKSFVSTLNPLAPSEGGAVDASSSSTSALNPCAAPPNTPNETRQSSPQPCSSKSVSQGVHRDGEAEEEEAEEEEEEDADDVAHLHDSDDDITLQDLVALETMDDADDGCDDEESSEQFFNMSSTRLDPFMSAILHPGASETGIFACDRCGLRFGSGLECRLHQEACSPGTSSDSASASTSRGKAPAKKKGGKAKSKSKGAKTEAGDEDTSDAAASLAATDPEDAQWAFPKDLHIKTEPATIKSELPFSDSSSQPALGGGANWKCSTCKVVYESDAQLQDHLDAMKKAEHKCASCHIIFDDRKMLLIHRRNVHTAQPKIKQEPAADGTAEAELTPNENGEYTCDKCDRAFKDKELCLKHLACHEETHPHECLECGKKFSKANLLRDHRRRHFEQGAFECSHCQKRFFTPNKLREHERVHTGEAPLACGICGKTFKRHSNLSEHKRVHMENRPAKPPKELFCHCGKVFKTQRDLDWHREGEHDQLPKKCPFCGDVFVHSSTLTRHVRLRHEGTFLPKDKKASNYANCPICNQMFYKTSINKHIRIKHQGQKPYTCDICKKSFVNKCNLDNHQWQHKGVRTRPFKCQLCRKAYLRQSLLDAHMRSHSGVKPFVCNECGLQFGNKSNWQRHVQEHAGQRKFECRVCGKKFSRGYYLTDHLKTHTGEKPYTCNICGKTAATRSNYNSHLRTHVTREPVNSEV